ncbi:MAG TPA: glycosyltransferase family 39 protein [Verrucomicrobiota bacterium]|nr:glycosyltransferase family 39 protein [Verrucomicrobiota bacterium]
MPLLQDIIHKLEVGPWFRHMKLALACLAVLVFVAAYNWRAYRNMDTLEAMDAAQVARNVSEGKGYTTQFVRPFSIYLVKKHNLSSTGTEDGADTDPARLKGAHPDLANAPLYPTVLAGWMKVYSLGWSMAEGIRDMLPGIFKSIIPPFNDEMDNRLWTTSNGRFWWHPHDFMIAIFNQLLLFVVVWLTFLIARKLFDTAVAWLSALMLFGCELLWRFSTSGLSTMLLVVIFMALVWCLILLESELREPKGGPKRFWLLAGAVGVLLGLGVLTRYAFGWLLIPVLVFVGLFAGQRKFAACGVIAGLFLLLLTPWVIRNFAVSGTPFGTAGYAIIDGAPFFSDHKLGRSLQPEFKGNFVKGTFFKFLSNTRGVMLDDIPKLAGGWLTPFFLVGLMLGIRNPATRRLRYFLLMSLGLLIVVQALGKTSLWNDSPVINSENLLVLFVPLILVYGVSLFFILLDQLNLPFPRLRFGVMGLFAALVCLPMIFTFGPPRANAVAYPPYFPPVIREGAGWMTETEMMMSDIPWAVAWYGGRQCAWLTRDSRDEFFALNDYIKPVRAVYLTQETIDRRLHSQIIGQGKDNWSAFALEVLLTRQVATSFPLKRASALFPSGQLFLTDRQRWEDKPDEPVKPHLTPETGEETDGQKSSSTNQPARLTTQ